MARKTRKTSPETRPKPYLLMITIERGIESLPTWFKKDIWRGSSPRLEQFIGGLIPRFGSEPVRTGYAGPSPTRKVTLIDMVWEFDTPHEAEMAKEYAAMIINRYFPEFSNYKMTVHERPQENPPGYSFLPLGSLRKAEDLAEDLDVSEVARGRGGFMEAYRRAGGIPARLDKRWHRKRKAFIKRHMGQVRRRGESLWEEGDPSRRHLALAMWAYSPHRKRFQKWAVRNPIEELPQLLYEMQREIDKLVRMKNLLWEKLAPHPQDVPAAFKAFDGSVYWVTEVGKELFSRATTALEVRAITEQARALEEYGLNWLANLGGPARATAPNPWWMPPPLWDPQEWHIYRDWYEAERYSKGGRPEPLFTKGEVDRIAEARVRHRMSQNPAVLRPLRNPDELGEFGTEKEFRDYLVTEIRRWGDEKPLADSEVTARLRPLVSIEKFVTAHADTPRGEHQYEMYVKSLQLLLKNLADRFHLFEHAYAYIILSAGANWVAVADAWRRFYGPSRIEREKIIQAGDQLSMQAGGGRLERFEGWALQIADLYAKWCFAGEDRESRIAKLADLFRSVAGPGPENAWIQVAYVLIKAGVPEGEIHEAYEKFKAGEF